MRSSKKAIAVTAGLLAVLLVLSLFLSGQSVHVSTLEASGQVGRSDLLIVGASQAECAFVPAVLDEELGCVSCNLAISAMTNDDKYLILEGELARNPVQTVVIEVSYNAMARSNKNDLADGNYAVYDQLSSARDRWDYLIHHTPFDNWLYVYAKDMVSGLRSMLSMPENTARVENRGYIAWEPRDYTLSPEDAARQYQSLVYSTGDYLDGTIEGLDQIVSLCKSYGARVIVAVVPISDGFLWRYQGMDQFRQWLKAFCEERQIECYDFNLHRQRYALFSDAVSYGSSEDHMSETGARAFSDLLARTIDAPDRDAQFYESYEELLEDSPYRTQ